MIAERELWACANEVLRQHGARSAAFIAERVTALALAGDHAGVATWRAIAARMDQLTGDADGDAIPH